MLTLRADGPRMSVSSAAFSGTATSTYESMLTVTWYVEVWEFVGALRFPVCRVRGMRRVENFINARVVS